MTSHTYMKCMRRIASIAIILFVTARCQAHPGHEEHNRNANSVAPEAATAEPAKGLVLPSIEGPRPWSAKPLLNDPQRFQIAIMTDRTGGHRPGIWMDAVSKLNLLRPEFVMSVGDLIEGYTNDQQQIKREWNEFLGFIDQMEMRFFFVAGNHDLTNPTMHKIWREHFGPVWYSFDYQNVHFVCLNSEDPVDKIGEEQLAWLAEDLKQHDAARWTLVFLHKPLWTYAERELSAGNPDSTNWKRIEALLVDRPHTIFAGHVHHYVQYQRNGQQYYSLATTGGGSQLRGNELGEFDHVMWLTMERDGPHLVNLRLDGMLPAGVVTEQSIERLNHFLAGASVEVAPILLGRDAQSGFTEGQIAVRLTSELDEPITLSGEIDGLPLRGLTVDPMKIELTLDKPGTTEQQVRVRFEQPMELSALARTTLTAKIKTRGDNPLSAERTVPVVIDRRFALPSIATIPEIDGRIEGWPVECEATTDKPLVLGNRLGWQGPGDASAKFFARHSGNRVYVAARVTDDRVNTEGDGIELLIDARPLSARSTNPRYRKGALSISASAPDAEGKTVIQATRKSLHRAYAGVVAKTRRTDAGYDVEFSIPLNLVKEFQGRDWGSFQATLVVHDGDAPGEEPAEVVWRGSDRLTEVNTGFGHFLRGQ